MARLHRADESRDVDFVVVSRGIADASWICRQRTGYSDDPNPIGLRRRRRDERDSRQGTEIAITSVSRRRRP
ncbi:MAG: hypothetical protein MZU84_07310 [Sphingobacterium sp.]|nr:hypothetical protein [Sphingobacterium sp.]